MENWNNWLHKVISTLLACVDETSTEFIVVNRRHWLMYVFQHNMSAEHCAVELMRKFDNELRINPEQLKGVV